MNPGVKYNHTTIESKWQERWLKEKTFSPDLISAANPFYNLMMFPYPSAEGLHVGNMYAFTGADVYGRLRRMQGKDVFEPIGLDGFGIHSENYAIKTGKHPREQAEISQKHYYNQLHMIGNSFDWDRTLETNDPGYYKWTQWLFTEMFKAGLAYKDKAMVNWCPQDKTVLSDEQVIDGKCERCGSEVTKREMSSWFFRITKYADRLLENIDKIDWPERIKTAQRNWIGKSVGRTIEFRIEGSGKKIKVFTTRPETLNSATFLALASEDGDKLKEKTGKFTGEYAVNPVNGEKLPVWETNYVESSYGTGAIMGVPAYDERDKDFAVKYHIDIVERPFTKEILGEPAVHYHLRDWGISRQRYWGPPIPMIYCKDDGWVPVPAKDLPVLLPDIADFKPKGDGTSPLHNAPDSWKKVKCPECGKEATRELDVSDTFLDSSWYFLRYPSVGSAAADKRPFDPEITKKWLPVDAYIGGAEHAVLHLMYARFVTMVLKDLGYLSFEEPFPFLFGHGLIIKDGAKMSKSKGNVVNPDEYIAKYGADALRTYLMFLGPFDQGGDFRDTGIEGMERFIQRLWKLFGESKKLEAADKKEVYTKLHQTIKKVTYDLSNFKYNTAIASLMEFVNEITKRGADDEILRNLCLMLAPFVPHLAEEVWVEVLRQPFSVHKAAWPKYDESLITSDTVTIIVQVNGKVRGQLTINNLQLASKKEETEKLARKDENVAKWLKGKKVKKVVFIPGKLVNFVF
jgi:leucyl-tRNA synthetase